MNLPENLFDRLDKANRQSVQLNSLFGNFFKELNILTEAMTPVRGITLSQTPGNSYFDVSFIGITLQFKFDSYFGVEGRLIGRVAVFRTIPTFSSNQDLVGSFTFDGMGSTSFESQDGDDHINIEWGAAKIVLYYLNQAVSNPSILPASFA